VLKPRLKVYKSFESISKVDVEQNSMNELFNAHELFATDFWQVELTFQCPDNDLVAGS